MDDATRRNWEEIADRCFDWPIGQCCGHSMVVDPWGSVVAEAGTGEQVLHAELDLAQVALARQAIPTSLQRRHDLYQLASL